MTPASCRPDDERAARARECPDAHDHDRRLSEARRGADPQLVPDGTPEPTAAYAETLRRYGDRLREVFDRATIKVVREQVALGIDIPTDGEIRRENFSHHCRHLLGIAFERLTKRAVRGRVALLPTVVGPIGRRLTAVRLSAIRDGARSRALKDAAQEQQD